MNKSVRFGIVGYGNIGSMHAENLYQNKIPRATLAALCDIDPAKRKKASERFGTLPVFETLDELLSSQTIDALIIATPHPLHADMAIQAMKAGLHVLTEKPAGIRPSDVKRMNQAAVECGKTFGIMFNQRTNVLFQKARELVKSGALGNTKRLTWIITNWYRSQSYYDSGAWRATWQGEGGGVLTNQSPHNLDLATWIFGMPKKLQAFCQEGQYHDITVEDFAMIHAEYENGATMQFITTTGEYPGTNRLEIVGEGGKIVLEEGKLKFWKLEQNEKEVRFSAKEGMPKIPFTYTEYTSDSPESAHLGIIQNFVSAVLDQAELLAPGEDGLNQVMLTTAAYLSAWLEKPIPLPFEDSLYNQLLKEKQEKEKAKQQTQASQEDANALPRWLVNWT